MECTTKSHHIYMFSTCLQLLQSYHWHNGPLYPACQFWWFAYASCSVKLFSKVVSVGLIVLKQSSEAFLIQPNLYWDQINFSK